MDIKPLVPPAPPPPARRIGPRDRHQHDGHTTADDEAVEHEDETPADETVEAENERPATTIDTYA